MFKNKLISDFAMRDQLIERVQPFVSAPISSSARVTVLGAPDADKYCLFISDQESGQSIYVDSEGGVLVESMTRAPALV